MNRDIKDVRDKITSYFKSTKNKMYGYNFITNTYHCIECGKKIDNEDKLCNKDKCNSKFIFRVK